jgi:predicted nucleic acid-binding protein
MDRKMWVIDASVTVKWFFADEEGSQSAEQVLDALIESPNLFFIPDLFYLEIAHVILKKSKDHKFAKHAVDKVHQLGLHCIPVGQKLLFDAISTAHHTGLTVHDAIYVETAKYMKAKWITADMKAVKRCSSSFAVPLQNFPGHSS